MTLRELIDPAAIDLSHEEVQRYSRHLIMPEVGVSGQKKLKAASVLLIGAAAWVPRWPCISPRRESAVSGWWITMSSITPTCSARLFTAPVMSAVPSWKVPKNGFGYQSPCAGGWLRGAALTSANALEIIAPYDIVIDGTDNFPTRYLTNDACVILGKPNVYGSIFRFEGQASVFYAKEGPCYRCLFPEPPPPGLVPSCAEGGVLGVLPGTIGAIQATEAIKLIIGQGESLVGRLLLYDALGMTFDEVHLRKNPSCPVCGPNPTITELIDYEQFCGMPAHDRSLYVTADDNGHDVPQITPLELKERLDAGDVLQIVDVREPHEWEISNLEAIGAFLVPQNEILEHMGELDMTRDIVVMCRSGVRSASVIRELQNHGFKRLLNLDGGINEWARKVDERLPIY